MSGNPDCRSSPPTSKSPSTMPLLPGSISPPSMSSVVVRPVVKQHGFPMEPLPINPHHQHPHSANSLEQIRLQQLYTLALADRMRFLHPAGMAASLLSPYPPLPHLAAAPPRGFPPGLAPPHEFHHPLYPYGKFDPRLFRLPEEPKPQQSYIGLISMAILSSPDTKLVLADIYQYILDNFPYFRHRGPGWRNSIRHNLSLNDCFIKAGRAANGKGHYWAIHPACVEDFKKGDYRRRKAQRKVRRHMGLAVDEEDSPSPPPPPISPPPLLSHTGPWGAPFVHPMVNVPRMIPPHPQQLINAAAQNNARIPQQQSSPSSTSPSRTVRRQFDVASLLGYRSCSPPPAQTETQEDCKETTFHALALGLQKAAEERQRALSAVADMKEEGDEEDEEKHRIDVSDEDSVDQQRIKDEKGEDIDVMEGGDDNDEDERAKSPIEDDAELKKRPLVSLPMGLHWSGPPTSNSAMPAVPSLPTVPSGPNGHLAAHEYLARYYQLMQQNAALQQHQQQHRGQPTSPASALLQEAVAAAANGAAAARKIAAE